MRLKKLKLAGFKSFVDPTVVLFPSHRVGVVGPNGCGKSNIIDAVRWVMGESSAKTLRGSTMSDVIFNGSTTRKPVGQASVELIFDNNEGRLTGEYAQYAEISIRRVVSRDGQSAYYLNGTRCRRKDVGDIFLGTGLGARSYAIIGQNTISQIIEAKPEDLRLYIEEAAGISKYKDRRKDAQSRMENTRENLTRIHDIREELTKQVNRLERQSAAAEQYTTWEAESRQVQAECDGMRWREWNTQLTQQENRIQEAQTAWEGDLQQIASLDCNLTEIKKNQTIAMEAVQEKQASYYKFGTELARLKETMAHQQMLQTQSLQDLEKIKAELALSQERLEKDTQHCRFLSEETQQLDNEIVVLESAKNTSEIALRQAEKEQQDWQKSWDQFHQSTNDVIQKNKVLQTRIEHQEEVIRSTSNRLRTLEEELMRLGDTAVLEKELADDQLEESTLKETLDELKLSLEECVRTGTFHRESTEEQRRSADALKREIQQKQGELTTLEALQQAALGKKDEALKPWLQQKNLTNNQRLAQVITVEPGWEKAVESILDHWLHSICVKGMESLGTLDSLVEGFPTGDGILLDVTNGNSPIDLKNSSQLITKIQNLPTTVQHHLSNIYIAEDIQTAQTLLLSLPPEASIITRDGIWLGQGFIQWKRPAASQKNAHQGILERERAMKLLHKNIEQQETQWHTLNNAYEENLATIAEYDFKRSELMEQIQSINQKWADCGAHIRIKKNQINHIQQRSNQLTQDHTHQKNLFEQAQKQQEELNAHWEQSSTTLQKQEAEKTQWLESKAVLQANLEKQRHQMQQDRDHWHTQEMRRTRLKAEFAALDNNIQQEQERKAILEEKLENTIFQVDKNQAEGIDLTPQWESIQIQHQTEALMLKDAEETFDKLNQQLKNSEQQRTIVENTLRDKQSRLEKLRLDAQTLKVKCQNIEEILTGLNVSLEIILTTLSPEANIEAWEKRVQTLQNKIRQLGPINLAALDEFKTESERKKLLDEQYEDLVKALEMLEAAIREIDQETRVRFQETYEKINHEFQLLFPRLFGGGQATMELTSSDCLEAGITIMAQPPGKRNSSIYLLSGGEKAMTAVALIFAIFQLNPSPFCMLDEVDAPLDDANVERFCNMVKEMSEHVQFIFITHNKITMELSTHLSGVTMHEPGVSRIVTVDVDEAISLVAS